MKNKWRKEKIEIQNLEDFKGWVYKWVRNIKCPHLVLLNGPMGSGKTQWVRFLVEALGTVAEASQGLGNRQRFLNQASEFGILEKERLFKVMNQEEGRKKGGEKRRESKKGDEKRVKKSRNFLENLGAQKQEKIDKEKRKVQKEGSKRFKEVKVSSPSFSFHNQYRVGKEVIVDHVDFYRVKNEEDLDSTGFWDLFLRAKGILVIEWAHLFPVYVDEFHGGVTEIEIQYVTSNLNGLKKQLKKSSHFMSHGLNDENLKLKEETHLSGEDERRKLKVRYFLGTLSSMTSNLKR